MPTIIEHEDPQIVIEKLARNRISEEQADAILRDRVLNSRPRGLVERTVNFVTAHLQFAARAK